MYSYDKPASLEEAFDIVRGQVPQKMKSVLNDPFGSFVANLAKAVKESKQTYVPKKEPVYVQPETFEEELIEEEELSQEEEEIYLAEALTELEVALQRARDEVRERQQLLAEQEAKEELIKQQTIAEEKDRLRSSLSNLEKAFQKAKNEITGYQQTSEDSSINTESSLLEETQKDPSEPIVEKTYLPKTKEQDNPYIKELIRSSQTNEKKLKGSKRKFELKKMIAEQIAAELNVFKQHLYSSNLMMGGGGGGTNAVQYAAGGTMNGNLNVNGVILSAGVDIGDIITQKIVVELQKPHIFTDGEY